MREDGGDGEEVDPLWLRNLGIVAHINAGKTTLTERILFDAGRQRWMGEVDQGTAAMDWMAEEQARGISISAAATRVEWGGFSLNLVDTPGHVDFTGEVGRCLRVLDGVVVVLDAVRGVESQTETVWRQADAWGVPRVVFVNKLDRVTADETACLLAVEEQFGLGPAVVVEPVRFDGHWVGILDVVRGAVEWREGCGPAAGHNLDTSWAARCRERLVDVVAQWSEPVLAAFVEGRRVSGEVLMRGLRAGCVAGRCVPVVMGSALENCGVRELLDAACSYLPSPVEGREARRAAAERQAADAAASAVVAAAAAREIADAEPAPDPEAPACAFVFKVQRVDGQRLAFLRVFGGTLRRGQVLACAPRDLSVPVTSLWVLHATERIEVEAAGPGAIVGLGSDAALRTGDTIHRPDAPCRLERAVFPRPVLQVRVEPVLAGDQEDLTRAALELAEEDPTLEVRAEDGGGVVVAGMGELHLEVVREQLERAVGGAVRLGRPAVARFETVGRVATETVEARAQVGGEERAARATVEVRPAPGRGEAGLAPMRPQGPEGIDWPELARDVEAALVVGVHAPHPGLEFDLRVVELDGTAPLPAGQGLYSQAILLAARRAMAAADPSLLEPLVRVEVTCPEGVLASVLRDLKAVGVEVDGVASGMLGSRVTGRTALARLLGYSTRLRSVSRGQATLVLSPAGFARERP